MFFMSTLDSASSAKDPNEICRTCGSTEIDWDTSFDVAELMCLDCANIFWHDYWNAVRNMKEETNMGTGNFAEFSVGDHVRNTTGNIVGKVTQVKASYRYTIDTPDGNTHHIYENELSRIDPLATWDKIKLFIGARIAGYTGFQTESDYDKETRRRCYVMLGEAGFKLDDDRKNTVRGLVFHARQAEKEFGTWL